MRTATQTGILVGAGAGVVAAVLYGLLQAPDLSGLIVVLELLLMVGAGVGAALLHQPSGVPAPAPPLPPPGSMGAPPAGPPGPRAQRLRAAVIAGALAGLGFGLAGLVRVGTQLLDPALAAQIDQLAAKGQLGSGAGGTLIGVSFLCATCFIAVLFPAVGAGLGALGGYILTALRHGPSTGSGGAGRRGGGWIR